MSTKLKYDFINVLKVESTCWKKPAGKKPEIIEISIGKVYLPNFEWSSYDMLNIFVRPDNLKISPYCQSLTGISGSDLKEAPNLSRVFELLREEYQTRSRPWASWGAKTKSLIEKECLDKDIPFPFTSRYIDLKMLFTVRNGMKKEIQNVEEALNIEGLTSLENELANYAKLLKLHFVANQHGGALERNESFLRTF